MCISMVYRNSRTKYSDKSSNGKIVTAVLQGLSVNFLYT